MKTGKYNMAELFGNRHIEQLVIPEIQRDYVWKKVNVEHLFTSILKNYETWQIEKNHATLEVRNLGSGINTGDEMLALQNDFADFYLRRIYSTNIGFVYAYSDSNLQGQYYLIDGQQRLTTFYLTLLAVAAKGEVGLQQRFRSRYSVYSSEGRGHEAVAHTKLDYRLREHTSEFLHRFVEYALENPESIDQMQEQSWYLNRFRMDPTTRNLFENYKTIQNLLEPITATQRQSKFYEYLEDLVECWYFDTNESEQGEELYIYLNARGESIAPNENLKAELLSEVKDSKKKDDWGRRWEEWQDYFWQKRHAGLSDGTVNPNADRGFNSFLDCVGNLEKLRNKGMKTTNLVDLETIKKYHSALCWLDEQKKPFQDLFDYADWVNEWFEELWRFFNEPKATEWTADLEDPNKSTAHNRMVLAWGSLLCIVNALEGNEGDSRNLDHERIFRAIRIFYIQYHNFGRAVASLPKTAVGILGNDPSVLVNAEEIARWKFFKDIPDEKRRKLESVIWKIEDHPFNLNAADLRSVNLSHLVYLNSSDTNLEKLVKVQNAFYELFPVNTDKSKFTENTNKVATVLLYYGKYWNRVSPWYYENYNLGDWHRTIRGEGSEENKDFKPSIFRHFFDEFQDAESTLDEFLQQKEESITVNPQEEEELRNAFIWYSQRLKNKFFEKGMYMAVDGDKADPIFPKINGILWNTKGTFKGAFGSQLLSELI